MDNQIKKFTESFFKNLKCDVSWKEDVLEVRNVPEKFEKFFGKQSPYLLVFDASKSNQGEVVTKGSYLLKAMRNFLENSGSTTLLKMNFDINPEQEIKKRIKLKNCKINKLTKKFKNKFFTRFTFQTNLQYLNKKDTLINYIFVYDGKIIEGNLNDYDVEEGNKKNLEIDKIKEDYESAKINLQEKVKTKVREDGVFLKSQLEKEINRIKHHYQNRTSESRTTIENNIKKIQSLKRQIEKTPEEKIKIKEKIERLENIIKKIEVNSNIKEIEEKETFEIKGEQRKHNLDIRNKLINTTIIYYPIFTFDVFLKNSSAGRIIEMSYNPLTEKFSEFFCESCNKKIEIISLCSSGHISCGSCLKKCGSCGKEFCKKCITKKCGICGKEICKDCSVTCFTCGRSVCKSHTQKDSMTGRVHCKDCLKYCPICFQNKDPKYFKKNSNGLSVCSQCFAKDVGKNTIKDIFKN